MSDRTDHELMHHYVRSGSEEAFGELVHRHVDLVYSTAFRVLHNPGFAEEVTQRVFIALARNAGKLWLRPIVAKPKPQARPNVRAPWHHNRQPTPRR